MLVGPSHSWLILLEKPIEPEQPKPAEPTPAEEPPKPSLFKRFLNVFKIGKKPHPDPPKQGKDRITLVDSDQVIK